MSNKIFHISVNGKEQENLSLETIVDMLSKGSITPTDYIYSELAADWLMLMDNVEVMTALKKKTKPKSKKPNRKIEVKQEKVSNENVEEEVKATNFSELPKNPMLSEWYLLKGENKFGPFQYTEVIRMLQEKVVFEFDFVWQNGMESWVRIAEIKEFCPEHIKRLQTGLMPEIKTVFFRRKHPRVPYEKTIVVHDNKNVWNGVSVELSEGGAGLVMDNSLVVPGQKLYMHFKASNSFPAFNAICEVVSKKFVDGVKKEDSPICYGVKFTNLSGDTHKLLQTYTKTHHEKVAA